MKSTECVKEAAQSWREKRWDSHFPSVHSHSTRTDSGSLNVSFFCRNGRVIFHSFLWRLSQNRNPMNAKSCIELLSSQYPQFREVYSQFLELYDKRFVHASTE